MKMLQNKLVMYLLVAACAFLQFSNTLNHDYAWDDTIVILENPDVRSGFAGLGEIWHKQHSDYLHDQIGYRPLVLSTFAIEQEFFPLNPKVGHLMNVVYFSILCLVILLFLSEIVPEEWRLKALLVTALFIVHPLHTEVVANIKSRDEIFQLLFSLLSIIFYLRWVTATKWWQMVLAIAFFVCAILSRENAIVTLALIPLTVLVLGTGTLGQRLKGLIPMLGLALLGVAIIAAAQLGNAGKAETEGMGIVYEDPALGNGLLYHVVKGLNRVANFNLVMLRYLRNFIWPVDLVYYYGYDYLRVYETKDIVSVFGAILTFGLSIISLAALRYRKMFAFGALFFFIGISPFLQQFNFMPDAMADRFVFGPSLGLCIASIAGVSWVTEKRFGNIGAVGRIAIASLIVTVFGFYSYQTFQRNKAWKDNFTLFSTDINKLKNCAKAHEHYADVLHEKYLKTGDASLIPDIIYHYQRSIEISDKSYYSFIKLGSNYASFGNPEMGIQLLRRAVELFPGRADPNFYLGSALYDEKRYEDALPFLDSSILFSPKMPDSYFLKIRSLEALGRLDSALAEAEIAVVLFPKDIRVRDATCDLLMAKEMYQPAFAHADTLLDLVGVAPVYWKKAIGIRQIAGYNAEAGQLYQKGLQQGVDFDN